MKILINSILALLMFQSCNLMANSERNLQEMTLSEATSYLNQAKATGNTEILIAALSHSDMNIQLYGLTLLGDATKPPPREAINAMCDVLLKNIKHPIDGSEFASIQQNLIKNAVRILSRWTKVPATITPNSSQSEVAEFIRKVQTYENRNEHKQSP